MNNGAKMDSNIKAINKGDTIQALLKEQNRKLDELVQLKRDANENQQNFEKKWSGFKKIAFMAALVTPAVTFFTGIVDPATDFPILADRTQTVINQLINLWK
jgi:hypothetical protein